MEPNWGKLGGSIQKEFKDYTDTCKHAVQENALTDERIMLHWVNNVLKPHVAKAPPGVVPHLILDKHNAIVQAALCKQLKILESSRTSFQEAALASSN